MKSIHSGNQFGTIARKGFWYAAGSVFMKASSFMLLPIYTRYLSPEEYGVVDSLNAAAQLAPFVISLQTGSAFARYYYQERRDGSDAVATLFSTHFWFVMAWGSLALAASLAVAAWGFDALAGIAFFPYLPLAFAPVWLNQMAIMGASRLEADLETKKVTVIRSAAHALDLAVVLVLLVPFDLGIAAKLAGPAVASAINFFWFTRLASRAGLLRAEFDTARLKRSLRYSLPTIPISATSWINSLSDRIILAYFGAMATVGLYSFSAQIAFGLYLLIDSITRVQVPIVMSALSEDMELGKQKISQFLSFYFWLILPAFLALTMLSQELLRWFTDSRYHSAYALVGVLAAPRVFGGARRAVETVILQHAKTWILTLGSLVTATANAVLNIMFVPIYGQAAAAWTTFLSGFGLFVWSAAWAQRLDPIRWNWSTIVPAFSTAAAILLGYVAIVASDFPGRHPWSWFLLKICLLLLYFVITLMFPGIRNGAKRHLPASFARFLP